MFLLLFHHLIRGCTHFRFNISKLFKSRLNQTRCATLTNSHTLTSEILCPFFMVLKYSVEIPTQHNRRRYSVLLCTTCKQSTKRNPHRWLTPYPVGLHQITNQRALQSKVGMLTYGLAGPRKQNLIKSNPDVLNSK